MTSDARKHPVPDIDSDGLATAFNGPTDEIPEPYVREVPPEGIDGDAAVGSDTPSVVSETSRTTDPE